MGWNVEYPSPHPSACGPSGRVDAFLSRLAEDRL